MSNKPLIAVTGATGAQGGSVVAFLLEDGGFRVRGITRNIQSEKARGEFHLRLTSGSFLIHQCFEDLVSKGVEVVKADFDDPTGLAEAFKGAYGVFGVTQCESHRS